MNNSSSIPHGDLGLVITWWWNVSTTKRNTSIKPAYLFWRSKILVGLRREGERERERERVKKRKKKEKRRKGKRTCGGTFKTSKGLTAMIVLPMHAFGFFAAFIHGRSCLSETAQHKFASFILQFIYSL